MDIGKVLIRGAIFAGCGAVGWLASLWHLPLAWVLGPLLVTAIAAMSGLPVFAPEQGRRVGQLIVGATIGLAVTPPVLGGIAVWVPLMVLTAVIVIAASGFLSVFFARFSGLDEKTAFFAMLPGGMAEMANIAKSVGARSEPIALVQSLRVAAVVCSMPPLAIYFFGIQPGPMPAPNGYIDLLQLAAVLVLGLALVWLITKTKFANPWMIGALIAGAILASFGWTTGTMPPAVFAGGQFLIGIVLGARFTRDILMRLPRIAMIGLVFIACLMLFTLALAGLFALVTPFGMVTSALLLSPGGLAEMSVTAKLLHLNAPLIVGFHVIRGVIINGFGTSLMTFSERAGILRLARYLAGSPTGGGPVS